MTEVSTSAPAASPAGEAAPPSPVRRRVVILLAAFVLLAGVALTLGVLSVKPIVLGNDVGSWFL